MTAATSPVLVIGAGVAGLSTALAAAPRPVILVSRAGDHSPSTALAQGGIAAALHGNDSPGRHARDTFVAGHRENEPGAVRWLCGQAPTAIAWLQGLGMAFDREGADLRLALEGGHGIARIVHAGGDATGAVLLATLRRAVMDSAHLRDCWEGDADALLLRGGRVVGARVRLADGGTQVCEDAGAVVIATGGVGALFAARTQPDDADGAGLALALQAGAKGRDLDRVQWHPTALDACNDGRLELVSEAVRGAGARLVDASGSAFMSACHPMADLAPRDVVAAAVARARRAGGAWLDARTIGREWPARFPGIFERLCARGIDPRAEPIPVREAVHFHMGGIATDLDGYTGLPGLLAVGEAACNGVHGRNRLASNSLLEGVVFGRRAGLHLATRAVPTATGAPAWIERGATLAPDALEALGGMLDAALGPQCGRIAARAAARELRRRDWHRQGWQGRVALALLGAAAGRVPGVSPTAPPAARVCRGAPSSSR